MKLCAELGALMTFFTVCLIGVSIISIVTICSVMFIPLESQPYDNSSGQDRIVGSWDVWATEKHFILSDVNVKRQHWVNEFEEDGSGKIIYSYYDKAVGIQKVEVHPFVWMKEDDLTYSVKSDIYNYDIQYDDSDGTWYSKIPKFYFGNFDNADEMYNVWGYRL